MESQPSPYLKHLFVCVNKREEGKVCCAAGGLSGAASDSGSHAHGGGEAIQEKLKAFVKANGLKGKVRVSSSGCQDLCAQGPNVMVSPEGRWYHHVRLEDVDRIIEEQLAPLVVQSSTTSNHFPVEAFLFDLGNVFVWFDHWIAAKKIAASAQAKPEELARFFFDSPLVVEHDTGRLSTKGFYEGVKKAIQLDLSFEQFLEVWNGIFVENQEMTAFVRGLLGRYPCYLISNTNRAHFEFCAREYPILNELTGHILSYEVGQLKPHPAIYQRALELAGVPASRIFYVDDRGDLVEAARSLGFQAHQFTGIKSLMDNLKSRGFEQDWVS